MQWVTVMGWYDFGRSSTIIRLSLLYGILCAKSRDFLHSRAALTPHSTHWVSLGAAVSLHGYPTEFVAELLLNDGRNVADFGWQGGVFFEVWKGRISMLRMIGNGA